VPRHVALLVTRLVAPLVVDYSALRRLVVDYSASRRLVDDNSASRRLVVDYFASTTRPGASAHRAAHHAARCTTRRRLLRLVPARRRLLRLCQASGCLGASRRLVVDYFASAKRPGASARRAARHAARHTARR
jgi:hypothetical protein